MARIISNNELRFRLIVLVIFVYSGTLLHGQASDFGFVEGVNFQKNVVYKTVDGNKLMMDIYYPNADKLKAKNPWMLHIHGGGWAGGNKEVILKPAHVHTLKSLVEQGVVCATISYRLARSPITTYESVVDCKDAARFLIKNATQFKLDKDAYGVWGGSAGGHLSLVTALVPDTYFPGDEQLASIHPQFKCVASFFPFTSCLNPELRPGSIFADGTLFTRLLGGTLEEKPVLARLLSPSEFLEKNSPPILLLHGDKDTTLPIINSLYLMEVAKENNANVQLVTVVNGGHSFKGDNISPSFEEIGDSCASFILSHLKGEE